MIVTQRAFGHLSISDYGRFGANAVISVGDLRFLSDFKKRDF